MQVDVIKPAPSILAADFSRLGGQVVEAERAGADRIPFGLDGRRFCLQDYCRSLDCVVSSASYQHLIGNALDDFRSGFFIDEFAELDQRHFWFIGKATTICTAQCSELRPWENAPEWQLATPASVLEGILPGPDRVLVMTVNPVFGHQHFLSSTLGKIQRVALMIEQANSDCELGVDGGIDESTAPMVLRDAITEVAH